MPLLKGNDTAEADDPDDVIDPDDSVLRLWVTLKESPGGESYALPAAQAVGREQITGRYPDTLDQSKAPQSSLGAPAATAGVHAMPDLLGPVVLHTMPPRVAALCFTSRPIRHRGDGRPSARTGT
jgi:hypothetical protein